MDESKQTESVSVAESPAQERIITPQSQHTAREEERKQVLPSAVSEPREEQKIVTAP